MTANTADNLIITATLDSDPAQWVRFTWSADLTECNFVACGETADASLEALLAADVHEGADLDGWTVTVR